MDEEKSLLKASDQLSQNVFEIKRGIGYRAREAYDAAHGATNYYQMHHDLAISTGTAKSLQDWF